MSEYQVLARKYRPKNFSELLGQTHISQALCNAIDAQRLHHAYLFTGTRGVGKTTIARILAKCLNCEIGVTSKPCGECDACQSIDVGRFLDLIEIDAASRTKVEDTRELLENVPYAPVQGRYKVYLIDEVHMLSNHSFNALLKTLEEPPEHVKFIFATTDPQKLPITIVSRCLQFVLRPLPQELLVRHLKNILSKENIQYGDSALWQLANSAKGSVRDCLSLTDQAIAFGGGHVTLETVSTMLGLVDNTDLLSLIYNIYQDNRHDVAMAITTLREKMVDAAFVFDNLIEMVHQMALLQILSDIPLDYQEEQKQKLIRISQQISADVLQLYYEILVKSRDGIRLATTPMQALEMAILRLLAFRPLIEGEVLQSQSTMIQEQQPKREECAKFSAHEEFGLDHIDNENIGKYDENTQSRSDDLVDDSAKIPAEDEEVDSLSVNLNDHQMIDDRRSIDHSYPNAYNHEHQFNLDNEDGVENLNLSNADLKNEASDRHNEKIQNGNLQSLHPKTDNPSKQSRDEQISQQDAAKHTQPSTQLPTEQLNQPLNQQLMLERLKAPSAELSGSWTPQKWDYWLSLARQAQIFDVDELALLSNSEIVGQVDGDCQLCVGEINPQVMTTFGNLNKKINQHYPNMNLGQELQSITLNNTPRMQQQNRKDELIITAQNQLLNTPVFQKLWQDGFVINDGSPVFGNFRLNLPD